MKDFAFKAITCCVFYKLRACRHFKWKLVELNTHKTMSSSSDQGVKCIPEHIWEEVEVLNCTSTSVTTVADSLGLIVLFVPLKANVIQLNICHDSHTYVNTSVLFSHTLRDQFFPEGANMTILYWTMTVYQKNPTNLTKRKYALRQIPQSATFHLQSKYCDSDSRPPLFSSSSSSWVHFQFLC